MVKNTPPPTFLDLIAPDFLNLSSVATLSDNSSAASFF